MTHTLGLAHARARCEAPGKGVGLALVVQRPCRKTKVGPAVASARQLPAPAQETATRWGREASRTALKLSPPDACALAACPSSSAAASSARTSGARLARRCSGWGSLGAVIGVWERFRGEGVARVSLELLHRWMTGKP